MKKDYIKSYPMLKNTDLSKLTSNPLAELNRVISYSQNTKIITQSFNSLTTQRQKHYKQERVALTEFSQKLMSQQNRILDKQLKKNNQRNSNLDLFYDQKISMKTKLNNQKKYSTNNNNLPNINQGSKYIFNTIHPSIYPSNQKYKSSKKFEYVKKIMKIAQMGDKLTEQSQQLQNKTHNAEKYIEIKYLKLKEKTQQIITGTRIYHLEEQLNSSYKAQISDMWMRADT